MPDTASVWEEHQLQGPKQAPYLKPGDRVRVIGPDREHERQIGVVVKSYEFESSPGDSLLPTYRYVVSFPDGKEAVFFASELEPVR